LPLAFKEKLSAMDSLLVNVTVLAAAAVWPTVSVPARFYAIPIGCYGMEGRAVPDLLFTSEMSAP
jgi:hypothetical protein